ncbi:MAG: hypothetical protein ABW199_07355 [Caulobacterales bacterium]
MPAKRAPRLKVYGTQIGLTMWAVAAPNRKAALKAWDVRKDLFASGAADELNDPVAVERALNTPLTPVAYKTFTVSKAGQAMKPARKAERSEPKKREPDARAAGATELEMRRARAAKDARDDAAAELKAARGALADFKSAARQKRRALSAERDDLEHRMRTEEAKLRSQQRAVEKRLERAEDRMKGHK